MDFFCIPIICGCQTNVTPEGDPTPRFCPRCSNATVFGAKSKEYFEVCFVPLFPFSTKHIWLCGICNWSVPIQEGYQQPIPAQYPLGPPPTALWPQNPGH